MNVFVIGASSEAPRVRRFMDWVEAHPSLTLLHDWLREIEEMGETVPSDPDARNLAAARDIEALGKSDVVVCLAPRGENITRSMWFELGYAVGIDRNTLVCGDLSKFLYGGAVNRVTDDGTDDNVKTVLEEVIETWNEWRKSQALESAMDELPKLWGSGRGEA